MRFRDDEQLLKITCQEEPTKKETKDGNVLFKTGILPDILSDNFNSITYD